MKFILDQNISRRLLGALCEIWPGSEHVGLLGLAQATDKHLWDYAAKNGYCIISKDSDFLNFAIFYGTPPKVVIIATGNVSTDAVLHCLLSHRKDIEEFAASVSEAVLVIP
ncbi:MAG: DUF5615 family PIN-like protein [Alphaproteobacteria bacterium]|nr:DUF5615 family PIN-like protein [Alphaproteobacteria bacterium]